MTKLPHRDFRDICIETLADSEAELREHNASLEADVEVYQNLLRAALDTISDLTKKLNRKDENARRTEDENRALREELLLRAGADDPDDLAA